MEEVRKSLILRRAASSSRIPLRLRPAPCCQLAADGDLGEEVTQARGAACAYLPESSDRINAELLDEPWANTT